MVLTDRLHPESLEFADQAAVDAALDEAESLSSQIFKALKSEILSCRLEPGSTINESALARRLGVSRTPVREALARLLQTGLIRARQGTGHTVTPITLRDVQEVYHLRSLLEGEAAALAAVNISHSELEQLELLQQNLRHSQSIASDEERRLQYVDANYQFHWIVARAADNDRLERFITALMEEAARYVFIESAAVGNQGIEESEDIIEALKRRSPSDARSSMVRHIQNTYQRVVDTVISAGSTWLSID